MKSNELSSLYSKELMRGSTNGMMDGYMVMDDGYMVMDDVS
jgi:hypothetical protein